MQSLINLVTKELIAAINKAYPESDLASLVEVTPSTNPQFGHYQCNSAMRFSKLLGMNARGVADNIVAHLNLNGIIANASVAGPGFINLVLHQEELARQIKVMLSDVCLGIEQVVPSKIVVDFSSPNIAKEMHVGHLRSTIIGDCLARLFTFLGYEVLRLNHVGDFGTAFGMLIAYLLEHESEVLTGKRAATLTEFVVWYRASKLLFDSDEGFKKRAHQQVVLLQSGDKVAVGAWNIICEVSRRAFAEIYRLLGVNLIERGESFYQPYLAQMVEHFMQRGLLVMSDGASCVFLDGFINREGEALPFMIQKSDGGYNYATTDLAALWHRANIEKAQRIIYVTDSGQAEHFKMLFAASRLAGLCDHSVRLDHVPFGLVLGQDRKKLKTRSGETPRLLDLLNAAVDKAEVVIAQRTTDIVPEALDSLKYTIGIGAVKYADLSCNRSSDYVFSYERMLQFEGNTVIYLMYSYVRVAGIKRKLNVSENVILNLADNVVLHEPAEIELAVHLRQFNEVIDKVAEDLCPNRLTDYLYELANKFNVFFRDCRVQGSEYQNSRLILCEVVARVLKQGMNILGLDVVEKM